MSTNGVVLLDELVGYLASYLRLGEVKDYPAAWNGLQVEGRSEIRRIGAAVDASVASVDEAVVCSADLLLVHHGLFWDPARPLVGRGLRRIAPLIRNNISVYASHLPLDAHPEVGNNAGILRTMGVEPTGQFGDYQGTLLGFYADIDCHKDDLLLMLQQALPSPIRNAFLFGPSRCRRVGVISGGAGALIAEAKAAGVDFYITGEGAQHTYFDARELEINVAYGGHYATETFGVKALAQHLAEQFGIQWMFLDIPTGL